MANNQSNSRTIRLALGLAASVSTVGLLTENAVGAVLGSFPDDFVGANEMISSDFFVINEVTDPTQVLELLVTQKANIPVDDGQSSLTLQETSLEVSSKTSSLSLQSIMGSLSQLRLDQRGNPNNTQVPTLPQTNWSDIYQGIYDFSPTATEEDEGDSIDTAVFDPFWTPGVDSSPGDSSSVTATGSGLPSGVGTLGQVLRVPQLSFAVPLNRKNLPSASGYRSGGDMNSMIGVLFAALPQEEVVNIDIFLRTAYRTDPRELLKRIDESLELEIKTEFQLMPKDIFADPNKQLPSNFGGSL